MVPRESKAEILDVTSAMYEDPSGLSLLENLFEGGKEA